MCGDLPLRPLQTLITYKGVSILQVIVKTLLTRPQMNCLPRTQSCSTTTTKRERETERNDTARYGSSHVVELSGPEKISNFHSLLFCAKQGSQITVSLYILLYSL
jgi:hypothetical protein